MNIILSLNFWLLMICPIVVLLQQLYIKFMPDSSISSKDFGECFLLSLGTAGILTLSFVFLTVVSSLFRENEDNNDDGTEPENM
jgi:hypothetical protein